MSFLDKPVSQLTSGELRRLIASEVAKQMPAIPAGVAALNDFDQPLVPPQVATDGQVLTYDDSHGGYVVTDQTALEHSDGAAPGSSPTPTVRGAIAALVATWTGVSNADPVAYEVHCSATTGFTPGPTTLIAKVGGTICYIRTLQDGSALAYGTTYYVKLVAYDADGSASAGSQGSGTITQVATVDLTDLAITIAKIADDAVTTAKIATDAVTATEIAAGAVGSGELAANSVIAGKIAAGTIVAADIHALTITASEIAANTITAGQIAANTITAGNIAANTLTATEIAADAITASEILAGAVTAEKLEAALVLATTVIAGTSGGARVEIGVSSADPTDVGLRAYDSTGAATFRVDGQDGSLYAKGRIDFGAGSRLAAEDLMELKSQASSGFLTPARVQRANVSGNDQGSDWNGVNIVWPSPTTSGNTLLLVCSLGSSGGLSNPTTPTIAGWTLVQDVNSSVAGYTQAIFKIENAASRSGTEFVDLTPAGAASHTRFFAIQMMEYANTGVVDVVATADKGISTTPTTTASGALAQAGEVLVAVFTDANNSNQLIDTPTNGFTIWGQAAANTSGQGVKSTVSDLITTSTSSVSTGVTDHAGSRSWLSQLVTFKADAAGAGGTVATPDAGKVRLYAADDADANPALHTITDTGTKNSLVLGPSGVAYRMEIMAAVVNIPSTLQQAAGAINVTLTGVAAGDMVWHVGTDGSGDANGFVFRIDQAATTTNQVSLRYFNADDATRDPASGDTHYFMVIHVA